jgi:uncharacterized protein YjiS (DUF1127 family)
MILAHVAHETYSFVKCQTRAYLWASRKGAQIMFARLIAHLQLRRSAAFLLSRADDHLLDDIGLTRAELEALHLGLSDRRPPAPCAEPPPAPRKRTAAARI